MFTYKKTDYIVLVKRFVDLEKRTNAYALVKLHFMKATDLNDDFIAEANSQGFTFFWGNLYLSDIPTSSGLLRKNRVRPLRYHSLSAARRSPFRDREYAAALSQIDRRLRRAAHPPFCPYASRQARSRAVRAGAQPSSPLFHLIALRLLP